NPFYGADRSRMRCWEGIASRVPPQAQAAVDGLSATKRTRESKHDRSRSRRPQGSPPAVLRRSTPSRPTGACRDNHSTGTGALAVHACRPQRSAGRPQRHTAQLKPGSGMALPSHAEAVCRAVHADLSWRVRMNTAETVSRRRNYFFTNFFTVLFSVNPPNTLPSLSAATPSGMWRFGPSSVMKAVTVPSLTLPIRMPCRNDLLIFSPDWESAA